MTQEYIPRDFRRENLNPLNILNGQIVTDSPAQISCPYCNLSITTSITRRNGKFTWLVAGGLCLIGFGY